MAEESCGAWLVDPVARTLAPIDFGIADQRDEAFALDRLSPRDQYVAKGMAQAVPDRVHWTGYAKAMSILGLKRPNQVAPYTVDGAPSDKTRIILWTLDTYETLPEGPLPAFSAFGCRAVWPGPGILVRYRDRKPWGGITLDEVQRGVTWRSDGSKAGVGVEMPFQVTLPSRQCGGCGLLDPERVKLRCSRCLDVCGVHIFYCSKACQVSAWPEHKLKCGKREQYGVTSVLAGLLLAGM